MAAIRCPTLFCPHFVDRPVARSVLRAPAAARIFRDGARGPSSLRPVTGRGDQCHSGRFLRGPGRQRFSCLPPLRGYTAEAGAHRHDATDRRAGGVDVPACRCRCPQRFDQVVEMPRRAPDRVCNSVGRRDQSTGPDLGGDSLGLGRERACRDQPQPGCHLTVGPHRVNEVAVRVSVVGDREQPRPGGPGGPHRVRSAPGTPIAPSRCHRSTATDA
jgi:hypothetical protein